MKWHSFFFLFLGVLSGTFISLVSLPEIKESKERRAFLGPAYLNSPNSTEVARQAGDDYLRIIQSSCRNGGEDPALTREGSIDRLRKLYDLAVIPVWTFTNRTNGLYLRQGSLNGDPSSWWNWNLILGDTVAIGSHLTRLAQETCGTGGGTGDDIRMGLVASLRTGSRLLSGNPQLVTSLTGIFWGERAEEVLKACPSLGGDPEVQNSLSEYLELCTVRPGIEWETIVLPAMVPNYQTSIDAVAIDRMVLSTEKLQRELSKFLNSSRRVDN